jgi:ParB/Sulfiredoxin domain
MKIALQDLIINPRRREEMGDLAGLASSIERYGLLHPIVIDEARRLIAGGRRVEACKRLGWTEIEATMLGELTAEDRDRMEVEENVKRKDLTAAEIAKNMKAWATHVAEDLRAKDAQMPVDFLPDSGKKSKPAHRPKVPDSQQAIADAMGVARQTLSEHVAYATALEHYPALEKPWIPKDKALVMAKTLDGLPDDARAQKVEALAQGQRNILADLAGLPPLPDDPAPPDYQKSWSHGLKALRQGIRELSDRETLQGVLALWTPKALVQQCEIVAEAGWPGLTEEDDDADDAATP